MGLIVFNETIVLIFYLLIGVFLNVKGKYTPSVNTFIGYFLTNIALPAAIINSFQVEKSSYITNLMIRTSLYSVVVLLFTIFLGWLFATLFKKKNLMKRIWINCITFSNILFIGIPIVGRLYGETGLIVLVIYNTITSLLLFTIGIKVFSPSEKIDARRILRTPPIMASLIGFLFFILQVKLPVPVMTLNQALGGMTAPLAMIINGILFSQNNMKQLIFDKDNLLFTITRSFLIPLSFIPFLKMWVSDPIILGVLIMVVSMPTGSLNAILAEQYCGEGNKVSQYIALNTIVCMFTLPIMISI